MSQACARCSAACASAAASSATLRAAAMVAARFSCASAFTFHAAWASSAEVIAANASWPPSSSWRGQPRRQPPALQPAISARIDSNIVAARSAAASASVARSLASLTSGSRGNPSAASSRSRSSSARASCARSASAAGSGRSAGWMARCCSRSASARILPRRSMRRRALSSSAARCAAGRRRRWAPRRSRPGSAASFRTLTLRSMAPPSSRARAFRACPCLRPPRPRQRGPGDVEEGLQVLCRERGHRGRCSDPGDLGERPELRRPRGVLGHEPVTGETDERIPARWSRPAGQAAGSPGHRRAGSPGGPPLSSGSMICPRGARPGFGSASHDTSMRARSASRLAGRSMEARVRRARSCSSRSQAGPSAGGSPGPGGPSPRGDGADTETGGEGLGAHVSLLPGHRLARPRGVRGVQGERDGEDADHAEDQGLNEAEPVVGRRGEVFQLNGLRLGLQLARGHHIPDRKRPPRRGGGPGFPLTVS